MRLTAAPNSRSVARFGFCIALLFAACADETDPTARFTVEFADDALRDRAELVRAQVRTGGCAGATVFTTEVERGAASQAQPGKLAKGVYGLWAAARDASCNWYAEGCRLFEVPVAGESLVVVLEGRAPERDPSCTEGVARGDAGSSTGSDEMPDAARPMDAGARGDAGDIPREEGGVAPPADGSPGDGKDSGASSGAGTSGADAGDAAAMSPSDAGPDGSTDAAAPGFDPAAPKCSAPATTVVACYDFEGTLSDATANHNDARGTARFEPALSGQGLRVGANTVRVLDDPSLNLATFTIEMWLRVDSLLNLAKEQGEISLLLDKDQQYDLGFRSTGALFMQIYRAAGAAQSTTDESSPLTAGSFLYLAFAYDGDRTFIYRDGTLIETELVSFDLFAGNGAALHIGSGSPSTTRPFDGLIDALRISRVSLGASEICHSAGGELSAGICR